jgi:hypothetical protein
MRFRWLTKRERAILKEQKEKDWHRWFAWKPVPLRMPRDPHTIPEIGTHFAVFETLWRIKYYGVYYHISKQEYFKKILKNPDEKKN